MTPHLPRSSAPSPTGEGFKCVRSRDERFWAKIVGVTLLYPKSLNHMFIDSMKTHLHSLMHTAFKYFSYLSKILRVRH